MRHIKRFNESSKDGISLDINESQTSGLPIGQTFNFELYKKMIIEWIKRIKKGEKISRRGSPFYSLIVNQIEVGDANKLGFTDEEEKQWYLYFSGDSFLTSMAWSQRDFNDHLDRKSTKRTYNYYITIVKDKKNILKFWSNLRKLDDMLKELSTKAKSPISYKTHLRLDAFVGHNDSLKVYYYDADLKDYVESIINQWVDETRVKTSKRTHYHGVDTKDDKGNASSFGELLADSVDRIMVDLIKKNGDKYTDEQYYDWIRKNFVYILSNIKVKE